MLKANRLNCQCDYIQPIVDSQQLQDIFDGTCVSPPIMNCKPFGVTCFTSFIRRSKFLRYWSDLNKIHYYNSKWVFISGRAKEGRISSSPGYWHCTIKYRKDSMLNSVWSNFYWTGKVWLVAMAMTQNLVNDISCDINRLNEISGDGNTPPPWRKYPLEILVIFVAWKYQSFCRHNIDVFKVKLNYIWALFVCIVFCNKP